MDLTYYGDITKINPKGASSKTSLQDQLEVSGMGRLCGTVSWYGDSGHKTHFQDAMRDIRNCSVQFRPNYVLLVKSIPGLDKQLYN